MRRVLLFVLLSFVVVLSAQTRSYRVPFHTVKGMILLDAIVGGKPASLLLDTGANNTILSPSTAGIDAVQLRALQATRAGAGAEGDYITREVDLRLAYQGPSIRSPCASTISAASRHSSVCRVAAAVRLMNRVTLKRYVAE